LFFLFLFFVLFIHFIDQALTKRIIYQERNWHSTAKWEIAKWPVKVFATSSHCFIWYRN